VRRGAKAAQYRWLSWVAVAMAIILAGTMAPALPAQAVAADDEPKLRREERVAGHKVKARPRKADPATKGDGPAAKDAWPRPGEVEVSVPATGASAMRADGLPVWIDAPAARPSQQREESAQPAGKVRVRVLDRNAARRAGVDGLLLTIARTDTSTAPGRIGVRLGYADFAQVYGGSYGSRLRLLQLPACAVTTPERSECRRPTPVPAAANNGDAQTLTADIDAAPAVSGATVLAVAAAPSGPSGDFKATSLAPSATWKSGSGTGDFSWSYPMRVPPVPGGLTPQVAVSYSSSSVDGRTANSSGQPSWLGEGFDLWPGYIERRYKGCADDGAPQNQGIDSGDQCWAFDNATITWSGKGGELIPAGGNTWRLKDDDGTRIERLTNADVDPDTGNGDNDGEHWKVTTTDGTQFFFGRNRLPGWSSGKAETKSTWTVPVFGNNSGEPCHQTSGFAASWCQQAWRWNLDYVVDPNGNAMTYYYTPETNSYGRYVDPDDDTPYERGGTLHHIEYGLRSNNLFATAPARVDFGVSERCIPDAGFDCDPSKIGSNPDRWWDVPWDQNCTSGCAVAGNIAPTFWTRKRLTKVTTRVLKSDGATYRDVEAWSLTHDWGLADIDRDLLLTSITHTGDPAGTPLALPPVTFVYGSAMPNRVDELYDDIPPYLRYRLSAVFDEFGGVVDVNYSAVDCGPGNLPTPQTNSRRCYPLYWQPAGHDEPIEDWFHKYVVTQVVQTDRTGHAPDIVTNYAYPEAGAAWHYDDDDGLTKEKNKTWSQWRGYGKVVETSGGWSGMTSQTDHFYFRGMDGDRASPSGGTKSVTVSDGEGGSYPDHDSLQGMEVRTVSYDRPDGAVVTKTANSPWHHQTASRTRPWGTATANLVDIETSRAFTALSSGGWRETRTTTDHDETTGLPTRVEDLGDVATAADDRCTTTSYAQNTDAWLMALPKQQRTVALACDQTPADLATQLISDTRTYYDGGAFGAAPTKGDVTKTEKAASASGASSVTYVADQQQTYDAFGRVLTATDAADNTTTTTYTDTSGLNTAMSVTTPPARAGDATSALSTSQVLDPAFGVPTAQTDAGSKVTNLAYDGLGRLSKVWLANRTTGQDPNEEYTYRIVDGQIVAVGTKELTASGGRTTSFELFDGLLRPRQTQAPGPDGSRLITDTFYDVQGKVTRRYDTYPASGAPETALFGVDQVGDVETQAAYDYDGLGRVTAERFIVGSSGVDEKWRTTTTYGGDRVHVDPPTGGIPTTTITDARGQTVELRQYKGASPTGAFDSTTYAYTPAGELKTVNGPGGNTWTYDYDLRGRKVSESDPDKGTTTSTYDDLDRLTSTTDAREKKLVFTYDGIGRKTAEFETSTSGTKLAEWTYDTARKGQPASTIRYSGGAAYTITYSLYDNLNRPLRTTYTIPSMAGETALAGSYTFGAAYLLDDTVQSVAYPPGGGLTAETVSIIYDDDDLQRPVRLTGYVSDTIYSRTGKPLQYQLSTGGKHVRLSYNYETGTQRLHESRVDRQDILGTDRDAIYSYDDTGNITQITDTSRDGVDNQCFRYDYLRRLTEAWAQGTAGACAADPTAALGGPAPYWQSFTYDTAGNRTQEVQHNPNGTVSSTRTYNYPAAGQGHKLTGVTQTGTGAHTETYGYDTAGNTTSRNTGTSTQTLTWDVEGELEKVSDSSAGDTSFVYDADGERLLRRDPAATTVYLDNMELRLTKASGAVTATRYYEHNGQTVAMRTTSGVQFLTADQNGTAEQAIDATTQALTQRRFTPFGQARGTSSPGWPGEKGYIGGTIDATTGLTHLGAREYDPAAGRFISVDPIIDTDDPQQMNGYAYSHNSPVTRSDPTGLYDPDCPGCTRQNGYNPTRFRYNYNPDNDDRNTARRLGTIATYGNNHAAVRAQTARLARDRWRYDQAHANYKAPVYTCDWRCKLKKGDVKGAASDGWRNTTSFVDRNWGTIATVVGAVGIGICIFASAGACVVAGLAIAGANYVRNGEKNGYRSSKAIKGLAWDVSTAAGFGYAGKGISSGWKVAGNGQRIFGRGWRLKDRAGWLASPIASVGSKASGVGRHAGPRHGTRVALGLTMQNLHLNSIMTSLSTGITAVGDSHIYG
jgi:RHS repeat-associated protein